MIEEHREAKLQQTIEELQASNEGLMAALQNKMMSMRSMADEMDQMRTELCATKEMKEKIEAELRDTYRRISELQEENTRLHVENGSIGLLVQAPTSLSQLQWKQCSKIPVKMTRGSACSHNNMVYFNPCFSNIVHCYKLTTEMNRMPVSGSCRPTNASNVKKSAEDSSKLNVPIADTPSEEEEGKWSVLPSSPYKHFSLAVVRGQLITIGGVMPNTQKTASVLSLTEGEQWVEQLPPMPTKRCYTTAATSGKQLVVLGGEGEGSKKLTTVEVMNTSTEQWQCAECLPVPLTIASSAVCAGQLYIGGGFNKSTEEDSSVYTCSLARLITQPAQRSKSLSLSDRGEQKVWRAIQNIPLAGATLVCVHGQLLALGGRTRRSARNSNLVHRYNVHEATWEVHGAMNTPRCFCLAASINSDMVVVGGGASTTCNQKIEIASTT